MGKQQVKGTDVVPGSNIKMVLEKKVDFFHDVMEKTILHVQKNKNLDIISVSDVNLCINKLEEISGMIKKLVIPIMENPNTDILINNLQQINNELSVVLKNYGTEKLEDLLTICFSDYNKMVSTPKFELLKKYFHPISYKMSNPDKKKKEDVDSLKNMGCCDISNNYKQFYMKVYGVKLYICNNSNKGLYIYGYVDDIMIDFLNNEYINNIKKDIKENLPQEGEFTQDSFKQYTLSFMLKDYLIFNNSTEIFNKFVGYLSQYNSLKQKPISQLVKDFISNDLFFKRMMLIQLLIQTNNYENQYISYLLYDLLSNDNNGNVDSQEQIILFDSLPWTIKQYFKEAMKKTLQYTRDLSNFSVSKIPLEQQICLLKAPESVKEKAMLKLKEVKGKSEDTGFKARQYLEGLLKIPFSIYKREPILNMMTNIRAQFNEIYKKYQIDKLLPEIPVKEKYTSVEINKFLKMIKNKMGSDNYDNEYVIKIKNKLEKYNRKNLLEMISNMNEIFVSNKMTQLKIKTSNKNREQLIEDICSSIEICIKDKDKNPLLKEVDKLFFENTVMSNNSSKIDNDITCITKNLSQITDYMNSVKETLDKSVYGHDRAKRQIERIIGQWINGDNNSGYCLGLEGPPGIGKTSIAKESLARCLKDEDGNSRPFAIIQLGGDCNSSTILGHNYTYVGSSWGSIVQILMDKKCMNPIILFDEVDKISKTEHGKEIVGVLTHLLDPTQNDSFQDKYFSGIDLDLSKVLFVLSYNDPSAIDKILLDRVHRIKFDGLTLEDKVIISNKYILPEIYCKMGLEGAVVFSDEVLKFIIEEYTLEPGVRKLKQLLFEIISEINLDILKNPTDEHNIPIHVTIESVKTKYFKSKRIVNVQLIHTESQVGSINCLYATESGSSGILAATAKFFPSEKFLDLKLTGLLDQMMQESFQISFTLAYNLTSEERKKEIFQLYNSDNKYGIHLHMGDGSINKSGTSAGIAITLLMYSLLNNKKINNTFAVTGEAANLNGHVGEIGALGYKFKGGIKAGVKNFIFPTDNLRDYNEFMEKHKDTELVKGIQFYPISHIDEAIKLIMVD